MIPRKKIDLKKQEVIDKCKSCGGTSCGKCVAKSSRIEKYAYSNIPVEYWDRSFRDFSGDKNFKKIISKKIKNIDETYNEGKSLMFIGTLGTGKSYSASCILKRAIAAGYSGLYVTMADVVANILSSEIDTSKYYKNLVGVDFLVIDEFSSHWIFPSEKSEQLFGSSLEFVLRTRFQNQLPTILCSNDSDVDEIFGGFFGKSFRSLRNHHVELYVVGGIDYRRKDA
jgi:DNA replication protein DnaC